MSRSERAIKGTIVSFVHYGLQIVLQALLSPLLLLVAGQETLGAYAALVQMIAFLALLDLGFLVSLARFLEQAFGYDDGGRRFQQALTTGRTFLLGTNLLFSAGAVLLALNVGQLLNLSSKIEMQAQIGLGFLAVWAVVKTPFVVYGIALIATQDLAYRNTVMALTTTVRLIGGLVLVAMGFGLVGLMSSIILAEAFDVLACTVRFRQRRPEWAGGWGFPERQLLRAMLGFSLPVLLMNVSYRLTYLTDSIVVSLLFGASVASIYYSTQMPTLVGWNMILRVTDNATPGINEIYARNEKQRLQSVFLRLHRYNLLLALPLAVGVWLLNEMLIGLWVGPEQYAGDAMTCALAILVVVVTIGHVNRAILMATGRMRALGAIQLAAGTGGLVLSVVLGRWIGLAGVMAATVIASLPTAFYLQREAQRRLGMPLTRIWQLCLVPALRAVVPSATALVILLHVWEPPGLASFMIVAGFFLLIHCLSAWSFGLNQSERTDTKRKLERLLLGARMMLSS